MDDPVPEYDAHPELRHAPPGTTLVLEDSDSEDEEYEPDAHWGIKCEAALSPRQLLAGCAVIASIYILNCLMWALIR